MTGRLYFVESGSRFEPLISFMREHFALDIEGAALVAHGDQPKLGGEFAFFWLIAVLPPIFLTVVLILAGALRRAETDHFEHRYQFWVYPLADWLSHS